MVQAASLANLINDSATNRARAKKKRSSPLKDVFEIQQVLKSAALDPETTPAALAQVARAWDVLEARKAVLRGIGVPRPVVARNDPAAKQPKSKRAQTSSFLEVLPGEEPKPSAGQH